MSVSINELAVWLPGRGIAAGPFSFDVQGLTVVAGRSGTGGSLLASALGGTLPRGALVHGSWSADEVTVHHVGAFRLDPPLEMTVAEALGGEGHVTAELWADVTGCHDLRTSLRELDPAVCSAVPAVRGILQTHRSHTRAQRVLLVLDQPLAHLGPDLRGALARALRHCADLGVDVCWVEHDLATAVPVADQVVELLGDGQALVQPSAAWSPRTLPLPPEAALARALGLPRADWWDLERLGRHPLVQTAVPRAQTRSERQATAVVRVPPGRAGVDGDVDVLVGETLGVVPRDGDHARALSVARRLAATIDAEARPRPPLVWPGHVPLGRLARAWCRARGGDADVAVAAAARVAPVDPARTLAQHSAGERRAAQWALNAASTRTEVLDRPEVGLDAAGRRTLAAALHDDESETATLLVSHDAEFLVRACHRLLVLPGAADGHEAPAVLGPPVLVADHLPHQPALRRAGARALRVRDVRQETR
ncbi:ABC transporter ATP-binding protein [Nocardioides campestrisoli]|uniref:ABC transporter ATP-binding protein n=1 Tax=Nocardioides campestrisoli TaxID=2736757 RepID=UPI00163D8FC1|nr:ABC transporter ATP-binding protein [Nocardioides campestrisoli]